MSIAPRTAVLGSLLAASCLGSERDVAIVTPAIALAPGCALARRARILDEAGAVLAESSAPVRNFDGAGDKVEIQAAQAEQGIFTLEVEEVGVCGQAGARGQAKIDARSGELLEGFAWQAGAYCPGVPFTGTGTRAVIFNRCLHRSCVASVEHQACAIQLGLSNDQTCDLPFTQTVIAAGELGLSSDDCTRVDDRSARAGLLLEAVCGAPCTLQIEAGRRLSPLPAPDVAAGAGCLPTEDPSLQQSVSDWDGSILVALSGCNSLARIDGESGAVLAFGEGAGNPLAVHAQSGRVITQGGGSLLSTDALSLISKDELLVLPHGTDGDARAYGAVWSADPGLLIVTGTIFEPGGARIEKGLLVAVSLSSSATTARQVWAADDVGTVVLDSVVVAGRLISVESLAQPGDMSFYRIRTRDVRTGALLSTWSGFDHQPSEPRLLAEPGAARVIVLHSDGARFCDVDGLCGQPREMWGQVYGSAVLDPALGLLFGTTLGQPQLVVAHHLDNLERVPGAASELPVSHEAGAKLHMGPSGRTLLVVADRLLRFRIEAD